MDFIRFFNDQNWDRLVRTLNALASRIQGSVADGIEGLESRVDDLEADVQALQDQLPVTGSPVTLTGTSISLINTIPSWARIVTIPVTGASTNGTSSPIFQLSVSGTPATSGYAGGISVIRAAGTDAENHSNGFRFSANHDAARVIHGVARFVHCGSNVWEYTFDGGLSSAANGIVGGGTVTLSGTLTEIIATTVGGANSWDAGSMGGIRYEQ